MNPGADGYIDQVVRRERFERDHPGVDIFNVGGAWQGVIKSGSSEDVITRMGLKELLDSLETRVSGGPGGTAAH